MTPLFQATHTKSPVGYTRKFESLQLNEHVLSQMRCGSIKTKRQEKEEDVEDVDSIFKGRHDSKFDTPRMICSKLHDDYPCFLWYCAKKGSCCYHNSYHLNLLLAVMIKPRSESKLLILLVCE